LHLLLDVDGVLQFGIPEFEEKIRRVGWIGDYAGFQHALFTDPEYADSLVGRADFRFAARDSGHQ
jgi:hypothetical protein